MTINNEYKELLKMLLKLAKIETKNNAQKVSNVVTVLTKMQSINLNELEILERHHRMKEVDMMHRQQYYKHLAIQEELTQQILEYAPLPLVASWIGSYLDYSRYEERYAIENGLNALMKEIQLNLTLSDTTRKGVE